LRRCPKRKPRRREEWFFCKRCHRPLVRYVVREGLTCVPVGAGFATRMVVICPACGAGREFWSVKVEGMKNG
jgi:RNase P subunit RPR2